MGLPQNYALPTMDDDTKVNIPFPAATKQAAAEINGVKTDVMSVSFADKIMITITQGGRIAQWVTIPLLSDNPTQSDPYFQTLSPEEDGLLPAARFQPRTLLGAGGPDREALGQLYASQIAHAITTKSPQEDRSLMLGLGLAKVDFDREFFLKVVDLVLSII